MHACCIAALCLALAGMSACRGSSNAPDNDSPAARDLGSEDGTALPVLPPEPPAPRPAPKIEDFDTGGVTEKIALRQMGAISPWDAVVNRGDYLGRRGKQGAIHGRLGQLTDPDGSSGHRLLIDETEGAGSLAVRVSYDRDMDPDSGLAPEQRVLVWGAWHVDDHLRWYWKAARIARLEARELDIPEEDRSLPGHHIATVESPPEGALPVSEAMAEPRFRPTNIVFKVIRPSGKPPESRFTGWEISDDTGRKPVARLYLPGERESYGAQDMRSPDEHWNLERNARYVVKVKRLVPPRAGQLARLEALNAPRRITGAAR